MNTPRLTQIRELFGSTPTGRRLVQELETEVQRAEDAERRVHGDAIADLERERDARRPALDTAVSKATAARQVAREKFEAALRTEEEAQKALQEFASANERAIERERRELRAIQDSRIAELRSSLVALADGLREKRYEFEHETERDGRRLREPALVRSNYDAVHRRLAAIETALAEVDRIAGSYVPHEEIPTTIEAVIASIPNGLDRTTPLEPVGKLSFTRTGSAA